MKIGEVGSVDWRPPASTMDTAAKVAAAPAAVASASAAAAAASEPTLGHKTATLPPGVAFVEEPSGIRIYVNNKPVEATVPTEMQPKVVSPREPDVVASASSKDKAEAGKAPLVEAGSGKSVPRPVPPARARPAARKASKA